VIAFGCASADERRFRAYAAPTIETIAENDSLLLRRHHVTEFAQPYNEMIAAAARRDDLEALVLIHQDLTIEDGRFLSRLGQLLSASPEVAIIGHAQVPGPREVETIGGDLVVLSPWACSELRLDARFAASLDASVADLCFAARAGGRRVLADAFRVFRQPPGDHSRRRHQVRAGADLRRKWDVQPARPPSRRPARPRR
jgi:hypothetical protein